MSAAGGPTVGAPVGRRRPRWRTAASVAGGILIVLTVAGTTVSISGEYGSWVPVALAGEAVFGLTPHDDGLLIASGSGVQLLRPNGAVSGWDVPGRVSGLLVDHDTVWAATESGLVCLSAGGAVTGETAFAGIDVATVSAAVDGGGGLWAGTADGLYGTAPEGPRNGQWSRLWPAAGEPAQPVPALLDTGEGVLFAHPDGIARYDPTVKVVSLVHAGVTVVSLTALDDEHGGQIWAGLRGDPLLLASIDGGSTWSPRSQGLGFTAVNRVIADPAAPGRLLVAGSGLATATGNAGVQTSDDGGVTWTVEQGRLSNTHVFDLYAVTEPVRLSVTAITGGTLSVPVFVRSANVYAGTNGGGVYVFRPALTGLDWLAVLRPVLRFMDPVLAGLILLLWLVPVYQRLAHARRAPAALSTPAGR